jgi:hypothetical protein
VRGVRGDTVEVEPGRRPADLLDLDRDRRRVPLPGWSRWLLLPLAGVLVVTGLLQARGPDPAPDPWPPVRTLQPAPTPSSPPIAIMELGHPLLGVTARWEVFVWGAQEVFRIEPARGRITRTAVPALLSGAPVSLVVSADRALVRSLDRVPGYVVPDGRPARPMPAGLGDGGDTFPGPRPGTVWVDGDAAVVLHAIADGRVLGSVRRPEPTAVVATDGAGGLVFTATGGVYAGTAAGPRRVTTGALLAAGPTRWLVLECDDAHRCRPYAVDRATGARRAVRAALPADVPRGVVAPDGRTAALLRVRQDGAAVPYLLDLTTGATRAVGLDVDQTAGTNLVWSPDSRWLFTTAADGMVTAVDPATGRPTEVGVAVQTPGTLAVRP